MKQIKVKKVGMAPGEEDKAVVLTITNLLDAETLISSCNKYIRLGREDKHLHIPIIIDLIA